MFGGFSRRWGKQGAVSLNQKPESAYDSSPKIPRVLLCVNRTSMFLFLLKGMGIAWLADVKSYFSFYFKRLSVHDIYDIGTRLSMNNAMSLRYAMAGELLCSNASTNAAWASPVVRSCRDKTAVSAIAGTDTKIAFTVRKIVINALSRPRLQSTRCVICIT
jgi:hypothetical protein